MLCHDWTTYDIHDEWMIGRSGAYINLGPPCHYHHQTLLNKRLHIPVLSQHTSTPSQAKPTLRTHPTPPTMPRRHSLHPQEPVIIVSGTASDSAKLLGQFSQDVVNGQATSPQGPELASHFMSVDPDSSDDDSQAAKGTSNVPAGPRNSS